MTAPLSNPTPLTDRQKLQAAILYHFASFDYLKGLHRMVTNLMDGIVDPLIAQSQSQNRDSVLISTRWGNRNTTANWCNNAWPFLRDYQLSLSKALASRAIESYGITDTNNCFRGMSEYSMQWATAEEEAIFNDMIRIISNYAAGIDQTLDDYHHSRWSDYSFAHEYQSFIADHPQIPKFRVRTDITGESGKTPSRTGVYITQNDPHAALQFAWKGNGGGKLRPAKTFNEIGLAALRQVGRNDLWIDDQKMFDFAVKSPHFDLFKPTIYMLDVENRDLAAGAVEGEAFADISCKWYFVEIINGEFEAANITIGTMENLLTMPERVPGGERCRRTGFYFAPSKPNSRRHFTQGEIVPIFESQYGDTIWQWDSRQD